MRFVLRPVEDRISTESKDLTKDPSNERKINTLLVLLRRKGN